MKQLFQIDPLPPGPDHSGGMVSNVNDRANCLSPDIYSYSCIFVSAVVRNKDGMHPIYRYRNVRSGNYQSDLKDKCSVKLGYPGRPT